MMKYDNKVVTVSNYATKSLNETLLCYSKLGYKLVDVVMARNEFGCEVMYLFFTKQMGKS